MLQGRPSYDASYKDVNPFDQAQNSVEDQAIAHNQWLQRVDSQESSPGGANKRVLSS